MLHEEVARLCNEQINKEFFLCLPVSAVLLLFTDEGLDGLPTGLTCRRRRNATMRGCFLQYLQHNSAPVTLQPIALKAGNNSRIRSCLLLTASLQHEQSVTQSISTSMKRPSGRAISAPCNFWIGSSKSRGGREERGGSDSEIQALGPQMPGDCTCSIRSWPRAPTRRPHWTLE